MKTAPLLALLAASALSAGALAQSTTGTTADTGGSAATTTPAPATGETSPSTGANTGSGSTSGTGTGSASGTPGNQSPNPNILGNSATGPERNLGGWGSTGFGGQPMMQGMMTCVSPAPMGGFGSFACYPAGWGMGSGMMDGWHDRMHYGPRDGRDQNRRRRTSDDAGGYDDDWRDGGSGYDDGTGTDDYSNP